MPSQEELTEKIKMMVIDGSEEQSRHPIYVLATIALSILLVYHLYLKVFRREEKRRDETVPPELQRQLDIARRNAFAHSLKPDNEKLPARMRVRLMREQGVVEEEVGGESTSDESTSDESTSDEERVVRRRVRFLEEEGGCRKSE